nr:von Willebrand factor type A domain containing [Haemonchus contortus]
MVPIIGITILTLGIGDHINRDEIVRISGKDELAFQNLHKNVSLEHFVAGFKNLSQGEHCEYARGVEGAEITCGPDFVQVGISTTKKLKGRMFFEGYHQEPGCSSVEDYPIGSGDKSRFDVHTIAPHGKCGLVKVYEAPQCRTKRETLDNDASLSKDEQKEYKVESRVW